MSLGHVAEGDPHVSTHNAERDAINQLAEDLESKIELPPGAMTGDLLRWDGERWLTTSTRFFEGEGPPDGKIAAPVGSRYVDMKGSQGGAEWVKRAGADSANGWIVLAGDTGLRNISSLIDKGNGTIHSAIVSRVGHTVDMYIDATMPSNKGENWSLFSSLPGFSPGFTRYAALQDNNEKASSSGTLLGAAGGLTIIGVIGGKRDRFSGTWSTRDGWPTALPGVAST